MGTRNVGSTDIGYKTSTDGLSLYLDARNPNSYPGTGTTWYDLSVGANDVSTYNNGNPVKYESMPLPNFTSSWLGPQLPVPFSSSYVSFYAPNLTTTTTVETVFQMINNNVYINTVFGWDKYWVGVYNTTAIGFGLYTGGDVRNTTTGITTGLWYHLVCEMRSDVAMINNKMYLNGTLQTLQQYTPDNVPADRNFNGGYGRIASFGAMEQYYNYTGNNRYSVFKVYNRALTQAEITNNYNYYKPIFNLS